MTKASESYNRTLGPPAAWLVRIARNRAIDRLRANAARGRLADASQDVVPAPPAVSTPEQQHDVARALDVLPPEQRELVEHAYFMGLTHTELAARSGCRSVLSKRGSEAGFSRFARTFSKFTSSDD